MTRSPPSGALLFCGTFRACARLLIWCAPNSGAPHTLTRHGGWKMKTALFGLLFCVSIYSHGAELATCRAPAGKSYYHYSGLSDKKAAGWADDKISNAVFTLTQGADGAFDVLFVDGRGRPVSSAQDGALVRLLRRGESSVSLLVFYPSNSTEIYTFFLEKDGVSKFTMMQSRSGDAVPLPKNSLLVGLCDSIRFDLLK